MDVHEDIFFLSNFEYFLLIFVEICVLWEVVPLCL
jgi:hypothetical protein